MDKNISHCDWEYLKTVTMLQEPHEPAPKFSDLLEYLAQPENEQVWAFIDIKVLLLPPRLPSVYYKIICV